MIKIDRRSANGQFYVPANWNAGTVVIEPPVGTSFEKRVSIRPEQRQLFADAGLDIDWKAPEVEVHATVLLHAVKPGHYTISEVLA